MTDEGRAGVAGGRNLKPLIRLATIAFVALVLAFVVHLLVRDWPETISALRHANQWWLVPAAICGVGGMFLMAWRWGAAIIAVGGEPSGHHRVISAFFVGEEGKYIPGAVWAMLGRSELARREGYERSVAYSIAMPWWPVALVAAIGITAIHPAVSRRILALASRVLHRQLTVEIPSWSRCLLLTGSYIPVWILIAAATTLVTKSLVAHPPIARVALAAVVSWIIGFITPAPGGIGVREAVFVAVAGIAAGPAAAAAILARVLFVLIDGTGAGVGWLVLRATEPSNNVLIAAGRRAN